MPEGKEDEGKRGDRISKDELMERVQGFCCSDAFEKEFESFAKEHSDTFLQALQFDDDSTEHPLEFHRVYRDYLRRFEGLIEDFISTVSHLLSVNSCFIVRCLICRQDILLWNSLRNASIFWSMMTYLALRDFSSRLCWLLVSTKTSSS